MATIMEMALTCEDMLLRVLSGSMLALVAAHAG
jgi:hypothetical protein